MEGYPKVLICAEVVEQVEGKSVRARLPDDVNRRSEIVTLRPENALTLAQATTFIADVMYAEIDWNRRENTNIEVASRLAAEALMDALAMQGKSSSSGGDS